MSRYAPVGESMSQSCLEASALAEGQANPNQCGASDNLNRMTASPGRTYANDILGNRTAKTPTGGSGGGNTWDCLNRLLDVSPSAGSGGIMPTGGRVSFSYRADGMRVEKIDHSGRYQITGREINDQYAWFRYDGQMPMETAITKADGSREVIDNGLGARGVDYVQVTKIPTSGSSTVTVAYPLYDAHGNEVATLSRSGSNAYALNNQRGYGAWGEIRQGATTGGPRGRYCGTLGHVQDDETGLIYMQARYYEVSSGRFISEDPSMSGLNWFAYSENQPVTKCDTSGRSADEIENAVRLLYKQGRISKSFWDAFWNRGNGLRRYIKDLITDEKKGVSKDMDNEDMLDLIEYEGDVYDTKISLETDQEVISDVAAGDDMSEVLLEEEVLIIDTTTGE